MKKTLIATLVALLLAVPAFAKDYQFAGCTTDHKHVVLGLTLVDNVSVEIVKHIRDVFAKVASKLPASDLQSSVGFVAFRDSLTDDDKNAVEAILGRPQVDGECK